MLEVTGDLWDYHRRNHWLVITTNGMVRKDGTCVMGRGTALQCAKRYPQVPRLLGTKIQAHGNVVHAFGAPLRLFMFPVKHKWYENADSALIKRSVGQLVALANEWDCQRVYLPRPGCGNGQMLWGDVKGLLLPLDDRFTVVHHV